MTTQSLKNSSNNSFLTLRPPLTRSELWVLHALGRGYPLTESGVVHYTAAVRSLEARGCAEKAKARWRITAEGRRVLYLWLRDDGTVREFRETAKAGGRAG